MASGHGAWPMSPSILRLQLTLCRTPYCPGTAVPLPFFMAVILKSRPLISTLSYRRHDFRHCLRADVITRWLLPGNPQQKPFCCSGRNPQRAARPYSGPHFCPQSLPCQPSAWLLRTMTGVMPEAIRPPPSVPDDRHLQSTSITILLAILLSIRTSSPYGMTDHLPVSPGWYRY